MTIKAVRAQIKLGDIDLDVFQLPDGEYRMSLSQVAQALDFDPRKGSSFLALEVVKSLTTYALQGSSFKAEDTNQQTKSLTLDAASTLFVYYATKGNKKAEALSFACVAEALERRADAAFGVQVSEEERQAKLALRVKSKNTRRKYTDVLKERLIEQIGKERYQAIAVDFFKNTTIQVNQHLYQQPHFNCDRDNMTEEQLSDIELFERQLERRAHRLPEHTAEELLAWMLGNY